MILRQFSTLKRGNSNGTRKLGKIYVSHFSEESNKDLSVNIKAAKNNLEKFDLVVFFEDRWRFWRNLAQITRKPFLSPVGYFRHINKSPAPSKQVTIEQRKIIEKLCEPDIEIYEHAKKLAK